MKRLLLSALVENGASRNVCNDSAVGNKNRNSYPNILFIDL